MITKRKIKNYFICLSLVLCGSVVGHFYTSYQYQYNYQAKDIAMDSIRNSCKYTLKGKNAGSELSDMSNCMAEKTRQLTHDFSMATISNVFMDCTMKNKPRDECTDQTMKNIADLKSNHTF